MKSHYLVTAILLAVGTLLTALPFLLPTPSALNGLLLGFNSGLLFCHLLNWYYDL